MRAVKLVQHMKANAERMSEEVIQKIRQSDRCSQLLRSIPEAEQKQSALEIYRDLTAWLGNESDAAIEQRYIALGKLRAHQGVSVSTMYWAICIAHEHLWEYIQQECLFDEPVEFWGGVILLRSLTRFFDRTLYFALRGYEMAAAELTASNAPLAKA